ncbi:MAG: alpha/beta fold hydrolase [Parvularculaceae bacterium]
MVALKGPRIEPDGKPTGLVIFCHGYGSNGDDLIGVGRMWRELLPGAVFVSPNAPEPVPGYPGGYQWFALDSVDRDPSALFWGAREAASLLDAFINAELDRYGLEDDRLALVGFSQGTMMALHVGLRRMEACAGILGYSGLLPDDGRLEQAITAKPPVFLIHGAADDRIPAQASEVAAQTLEKLGVPTRLHISPGVPHSIGQDGLELGGRFLAEVLAAKAQSPQNR